MIELMFLTDLMLVKQVHQKGVMCLTTGIFKVIDLSFNQMSAIAIDVMTH